jgi:PAS domain S-box-containing protein
MSISLAKKAIILVALPLVCEASFVAGLSLLICQLEDAREKENHAREISAHVNGALVNLLDRFSSCILYHVSDSDAFKRRFAGARGKIQTELSALRAVTASYPDEKVEIEALNDRFIKCGEDLQRAQGQLELGDKVQAARLWVKADKGIEVLLGSIDDIILSQEKVLQAKRLEQKHLVKTVEIWLLGGILFNIAISAALIFFFNRSATRHLQLLIDNTVRLAAAKPLGPPINGDDEFAYLDKTFREMAQALDESHRKERAVVENAADVICSLDRAGVFTAVNPAVTRLWGYTPVEVIGQPLSTFVAPEDFKGTVQAISEIVSSHLNEGVFENRILNVDQELVDFAWSAHWSARDKSLFCVARDISERREIDRIKADFVAMVSHDLRTPLTSIQMVLSLVAAGAYGRLSDIGLEKLEAAEGNVDRLIGLVNGLLDLEKMESGKLELVLGDCSVKAVIKASKAAVAGFAEQQGVELEIGRFAPRSSDIGSQETVWADQDRIVQVVINLLSNAVKFSKTGGKVILQIDHTEKFVRFAIADQGRGVPADMLEAVFDRFQQVQVSDSKTKGGSGLGLAICKAIVERHGGRIGVESVLGQGSTFWFTLPRSGGS